MSDDLDPILELRFYNVASGRDSDMRARVQNDLKWLFPRHGVRPIGSWSAIDAPSLPTFVYITPFKNMIERNRCWGGFYADPDWQEVRNRTNAGSELVADYEIYFVRSMSEWNNSPAPEGSVDEVVFHRTLVGKGLAAAKALNESEIPALERAGATRLGSFDIMSGRTLPSAVSFIRWESWEARRNAEKTLENDKALLAQRAEETMQFGQPLIGRKGSFLLEPVAVDWE